MYEYKLCITKHGEFEIQQMPSSCDDLKEYVRKYLEQYVKIDSIFGFYNPELPKDEQRYSGFGEGRFISDDESREYKDLSKKYGTSKKRKETQILFKQEADVALAIRAKNNVVLTFDVKNGPLKEISGKGGKVIFLNVQESKNISSDRFMSALLSEIEKYKT